MHTRSVGQEKRTKLNFGTYLFRILPWLRTIAASSAVSGRIPKRRSQILLDGVKKSDRGSPQGHILISWAGSWAHQQRGSSHDALLAIVDFFGTYS